MGARIEISGVRKSFGAQAVLRGIDLVVEPGQITTVLGGSGSGKSVLLKHVIGLLKPDQGEVRVDGRSWAECNSHERKELRRKFGYLFQGTALFDSLTVEQNVAFPLVEHRKWTKAQISDVVDGWLTELGLQGAERKLPSEISGGMRKRVALARAMVLEPAVVLYDEPTTGLDPLTTRHVNELIHGAHRRRGMTAILVSHDLPSAFRYSDRIVVLLDGLVACEGTPAEVLGARHPFVTKMLDAVEVHVPAEQGGRAGRPFGLHANGCFFDGA